MIRRLSNIYRLGIKELWSLRRDPIMLVLIVYTFTVSIYSAATAQPDTLHKAPIAVVDEDASPLSGRIVEAFFRRSSTRPRSFHHRPSTGVSTPARTHSRSISRRISSATFSRAVAPSSS